MVASSPANRATRKPVSTHAAVFVTQLLPYGTFNRIGRRNTQRAGPEQLFAKVVRSLPTPRQTLAQFAHTLAHQSLMHRHTPLCYREIGQIQERRIICYSLFI